MAKSIITDNLDSCFVCGAMREDLHHCPYGSDHKQADYWGLLFPLCRSCHSQAHLNPNTGIDLELKRIAQRTFTSRYPEVNWRDYFSKNYL